MIDKNNNQQKSDKLLEQPIEEEIKSSYLDYAMSVIVSRALPDVRDGLKPVQRRILYAMWKMGLKSGAKYRKSAAVVGEVLGKFHPHGDVPVYDALARMSQDFSLRYPLIDGQGNWGSIDGDPPAAMRYTECRLSPISETMLEDIEKDVVKFVSNYDATLTEPTVLPAKLPNLLINGALGIAVGMATSIPPHNLSEVCQAIRYLIDHPKATIDDLMNFIKGPDFPTGGLIFDPDQIKQTYQIGKGPIVVRAKTEIIETKLNQFQIVITEIPYQVNKSDLLQRIANLVQTKKISDIKNIRDESDKEGIRIVIELKKHSFPQKILNQLFKLTDLQTTFHLNLVCLTENGLQPRLLDLKSVLEEYIKHRQIIIRKKTEFDLAKTKERVHILKGLKIALDHINEVINLIKKSKDQKEAKTKLIKKYKLSERQVNAILEMKLQQLARLERIKIEDELKEKTKFAKLLKDILEHPRKILDIIKKDLDELEKKYGDSRKTKVIPRPITEFKQEDLIPDEPTLILLTKSGYIKRLSPENFKRQTRGGKGIIGLETKEEDVVERISLTTTHADLLFFTTKGKVFLLKAYDIPESSRTSRGQSLANFLQIESNEKISTLLVISSQKKPEFLIMVTKSGIIKKTKIDDFSNVRRSGLLAIKLKSDDQLNWVEESSGNDEIILVTALGKAIRFKEKDLRPMGRIAAGVRGIKLNKDDYIVGMGVLKSKEKANLLVITENGFGKMTPLNNYRLQHRGGTGIKTAKITERNGKIIGAKIIYDFLPEYLKGDLLIISQKGQVIRIPLKSVPSLGRSTQGVRLMRLKIKGDKVASITIV